MSQSKLTENHTKLLKELREENLAFVDFIYRATQDLLQKTLNINFDMQSVSRHVLGNNLRMLDEFEAFFSNLPDSFKENYHYSPKPILMSARNPDGCTMDELLSSIRCYALEKRQAFYRERAEGNNIEAQEVFNHLIFMCSSCINIHLESMDVLESAKGKEIGPNASRIGINAVESEDKAE